MTQKEIQERAEKYLLSGIPKAVDGGYLFVENEMLFDVRGYGSMDKDHPGYAHLIQDAILDVAVEALKVWQIARLTALASNPAWWDSVGEGALSMVIESEQGGLIKGAVAISFNRLLVDADFEGHREKGVVVIDQVSDIAVDHLGGKK